VTAHGNTHSNTHSNPLSRALQRRGPGTPATRAGHSGDVRGTIFGGQAVVALQAQPR